MTLKPGEMTDAQLASLRELSRRLDVARDALYDIAAIGVTRSPQDEPQCNCAPRMYSDPEPDGTTRWVHLSFCVTSIARRALKEVSS